MIVRPIDMTITIQNAADANRAGSNEHARPETVQQQFAERLQKEFQLNDQHVMQTNKTEENRVDRDGRGNGGGGPGGKRGGKDKKDARAPRQITGGGSMLDISV